MKDHRRICIVTLTNYFFLLAGTVSLIVDGKESTIVPGSLVFTPRGAVHSFKNIGTSSAKLLEWTIPGGNEPYFRAVNKMEANAGSIQSA